jgi:hypothetical protein
MKTSWALVLLLLPALGRANSIPCNATGLKAFGMTSDGTLTDAQACLIFNDLVWLKSARLGSNGDYLKKFYGVDDPDKAGEKVIDWLKTRMTKVGKLGVHQAFAANLGHASRAKATPTDYAYGHVVFTDEFFKLSSRVQRVGVYVHEARHSDGDKAMKDKKVDAETNPDTSHGGCRVAGMAGTPAPAGTVGDSGCDRKFNGAYAYQCVLMKNLAEACITCSQAEKDEAKADAKKAFIPRHDEIPDYQPPR